jgi:hypothetical protein
VDLPPCTLPQTSAAFCYSPPPFEILVGQGEQALSEVGEVLLFSFEFRRAAVRRPAGTLAYGSPDLLGYDIRLVVP